MEEKEKGAEAGAGAGNALQFFRPSSLDSILYGGVAVNEAGNMRQHQYGPRTWGGGRGRRGVCIWKLAEKPNERQAGQVKEPQLISAVSADNSASNDKARQIKPTDGVWNQAVRIVCVCLHMKLIGKCILQKVAILNELNQR